MQRATVQIDKFVEKLHSTSSRLADQAKAIFKDYRDAKPKGSSEKRLPDFAAAAIYIAYRSMDAQMPLSELASVRARLARNIHKTSD